MNEKLTLQDLVDLLIQKKGIVKKDAELFLKELFSVITDAVSANESVKVKDLGTFKLTPVSRRESVDVNTGEKIEIPAHYRLSFQPDKELRELVNKPFASFESIMLEDDEDGHSISFGIDENLEDEEGENEILDIEEGEEEELSIQPKPAEIIQPPVVEAKKTPFGPEDKLAEPRVEKTPTPLKTEEKEQQKTSADQALNNRSEMLPRIPQFEYSYSTTMDIPSESESGLPSIKTQPILEDELREKSLFRESSSNDEALSEAFLASKQQAVVAEESTLSRNLLSGQEEDELDEEVSKELESEEAESNEITEFDDTPDFYSYKASFWAKIWRKLPLILFVLIVLGGLTYAFLKLFNVDLNYERFFTKKFTTSAVVDSLPDENRKPVENVLELDSVAGITSKKLDSLRLQIKTNEKADLSLLSPKENIPNVNKAESKLMTQQRERTSDSAVKETIKVGATLRTLASRYYGKSAFWVYIYEENKAIIDDPDNIPLGLQVSIPKAEKYGIDAKNINSLSKAKEKELETVRLARQKRFQQAQSN